MSAFCVQERHLRLPDFAEGVLIVGPILRNWWEGPGYGWRRCHAVAGRGFQSVLGRMALDAHEARCTMRQEKALHAITRCRAFI